MQLKYLFFLLFPMLTLLAKTVDFHYILRLSNLQKAISNGNNTAVFAFEQLLSKQHAQ